MRAVFASWIAAVVFAAPLSAAAPARPSAEPLSPERVRAALELGSKGEGDLDGYLLKTEPTWTVHFDTPFLRVAQLARGWKKRGREIKESDVPAALIAPEVHVYAQAVQQPGVTETPRNIEHLVLHRPGSTETIPPVSIQTNLNRARTRSDIQPAKIAQSAEAVFSQADFQPGTELRIQFGDRSWESVVLTRAALESGR